MTMATWALIFFFKMGYAGGATTVYFETEELCKKGIEDIQKQYGDSWVSTGLTCVQVRP